MTTPFRFFHCADLLLDAPFPSRAPGARAQLRAESWRTLRNLVDACLQEKVDALLVSGGLFDEERLELSTERFLAAEMRRLTAGGVTVVAACGPADPGRAGGRARGVDWPAERFHLVTDAAGAEILVTDAGGDAVGRVIARGHEQSTGGDLLDGFDDPSGPEPAVGLAPLPAGPHADGDDEPDLTGLSERGLRYWALGGRPRGERLALPVAWMPGPLFPHGFADAGPCGALLVTLPERGDPEVEFRPLATARFETLAPDGLQGLADFGAVVARCGDALDEALTDPGAGPAEWWMARFELSGPCPAAGALATPADERRLADALSGRAGVLDVTCAAERLAPVTGVDATAGDADLLGLSLQLIEQAAHDDQLLERLAPAQLAGCVGAESEVRAAYLRELLGDMAPLAAAALSTGNDA